MLTDVSKTQSLTTAVELANDQQQRTTTYPYNMTKPVKPALADVKVHGVKTSTF